MSIVVGHPEANIACTIVLLKRMMENGMIEVPSSVILTGGSYEGWRRAATQFLDAGGFKRKPRVDDSGAWAEFNEELDWYDRKERARV